MILHTIYNPTDKIIQLPGEYCNLVVNTNAVRTIIDHCEVNLVYLYPNEYSFIGTTEIYSSILNYGENIIEISLPGTQYKDSIILNHDIDVSQSLARISGQIVIEELENRKSNAVKLSLNLEQEFLDQTDDCSIYVDIINDLGEPVHNQIVNVCETVETSANDFISTPIDLWEPLMVMVVN